MKPDVWTKTNESRRCFIGGSDARIIMGDDEPALLRLWREKRGEVEPEDLSGNLIVQLGSVTEELNRRWYERNTGQIITSVQRQVFHPVKRWMAATLDGMVKATGAVFEAKFMLPWTFSEEGAAANRRNAIRSTGPITKAGKRRSRQNAVRHGLAAETVIEPLEDIEDYRGFEAAVIASYDARNAVERELVLRLASLLWRLRRATAIETDLLRIQAEISRELKFRQETAWPRDIPRFGSVGESSGDRVDHDEAGGCNAFQEMWGESDARTQPARSRGIAHCFLRLINIDSGVFERLGRYESTLSRQMFRILLLLQSARAR